VVGGSNPLAPTNLSSCFNLAPFIVMLGVVPYVTFNPLPKNPHYYFAM